MPGSLKSGPIGRQPTQVNRRPGDDDQASRGSTQPMVPSCRR
ncbi:transposase [Sphingomonas sp. BHC-A]|nr:transposase [Sphingomonas sp. BHC-A]